MKWDNCCVFLGMCSWANRQLKFIHSLYLRYLHVHIWGFLSPVRGSRAHSGPDQGCVRHGTEAAAWHTRQVCQHSPSPHHRHRKASPAAIGRGAASHCSHLQHKADLREKWQSSGQWRIFIGQALVCTIPSILYLPTVPPRLCPPVYWVLRPQFRIVFNILVVAHLILPMYSVHHETIMATVTKALQYLHLIYVYSCAYILSFHNVLILKHLPLFSWTPSLGM